MKNIAAIFSSVLIAIGVFILIVFPVFRLMGDDGHTEYASFWTTAGANLIESLITFAIVGIAFVAAGVLMKIRLVNSGRELEKREKRLILFTAAYVFALSGYVFIYAFNGEKYDSCASPCGPEELICLSVCVETGLKYRTVYLIGSGLVFVSLLGYFWIRKLSR